MEGFVRWKFSRKKVILLEVLAYYWMYWVLGGWVVGRFPKKIFFRQFVLKIRGRAGLTLRSATEASCPEKVKKLPVFLVQLNPVPVVGAKKILVPFDGKFSPKFPYKW